MNNNNSCIDRAIRLVLRNKVLFNYIFYIVRDTKESRKLQWIDVIESPHALIKYGYLFPLKSMITQLENNSDNIDVFQLYIAPHLKYAAKHLHILKFLHEKYPNKDRKWPNSLMIHAAEYNNLDVIKYIFENNKEELVKFTTDNRITEVFQMAFIGGNMEILKYLHENTPYRILAVKASLEKAASKGYLDVLKFAHENNCFITPTNISICSLIELAAVNNHFKVFEFLYSLLNHRDTPVKFSNQIFRSVCKFGRLDLLKRLVEYQKKNNCFNNDIGGVIDAAATHGHMDIIEYLHTSKDMRITCTHLAMNMAAEKGHLGVVKYLHENRTEGCSEDAMNNAAMNGHSDVVLFLHHNRTEGCSELGIIRAASTGRIEMVKFLHSICAKFTKIQDAITSAARYGHLEIVRFLHSKSKDYRPSEPLKIASRHGHLNVVRFLYEENINCFPPNSLSECYVTPNIDIIKYLFIEKSVKLDPIEPSLKNMIENRLSDNVIFLLGMKSSNSLQYKDLPQHAAMWGDIKLIDYMLDKYNNVDVTTILRKALSAQQFRLIDHLYERYCQNQQHQTLPICFSLEPIVDWLCGREQHIRCNYLDRFLKKFINQNRFQFRLGILRAESMGHFPMYHHLLLKYKDIIQFNTSILDEAISHNQMNVAMTFIESIPEFYTRFTLQCVGNEPQRYMPIFETFWDNQQFKSIQIDKFSQSDKSIMLYKAIENGNLDFIKFLHALSTNSEKCQVFGSQIDAVLLNKNTMDTAASEGQIEILEFLHTHRTDGCTKLAMDGACLRKNDEKCLQTVMWLHQNRTEGCTDQAFKNAIRKGHIKTLTFLLENRTEGNIEESLKHSIDFGAISFIEFLRGKLPRDSKMSDSTMLARAASKNDIRTTKWLLDQCHDYNEIAKACDVLKDIKQTPAIALVTTKLQSFNNYIKLLVLK